MKKLLVGAVVCVAVMGIVGSAFAEDAAKPKKKADPSAAFAKKDKNGDGKISVEEFIDKKEGKAAEKATKSFAKKDKDGDGFLCKAEMAPKAKKAAKKCTKKKADNEKAAE